MTASRGGYTAHTWWKTVGAVVVVCAATAIALPAQTFTTLANFAGTGGTDPLQISLAQGTDGNLYGTTLTGPNNSGTGSGTIFMVTPAGTLTTLYSFGGADGAKPYAGLVLGTDSNFYGTTAYGGAHGYGNVFKITPAGVLTTMHSFDSTDGAGPYGGLAQATSGIFYGTTYGGGTSYQGTVFSLAVGLGPFVTTLPTSGKVGATVRILGTNLTGATSVTFNGTAAVFTVISPTLISTIVPAGATTGTVQVTTPSGTLTSNVSFTVP